MSNNNTALYLSEGTCYYGAGTPSSSDYLPCGNAELSGPQACCYKGDYCLAENTCWDYATDVTYIAGCTDSAFRASVCPQRFGYPNQQWVALARGNGADISKWSGCGQHPQEIKLEKENCSFNSSNVLIEITNTNADGTIPEYGQLPNATGQAIVFAATASPTLLSASTGGSNNGLSTGAKAGIGVGVAIGGLLIIGLLAFFFLRMRKNKTHSSTRDAEKSEVDSYYTHRHESGGAQKVEAPGERMNGSHKAELFTEGQIGELNNTNRYNGEVKGGSGNPMTNH